MIFLKEDLTLKKKSEGTANNAKVHTIFFFFFPKTLTFFLVREPNYINP